MPNSENIWQESPGSFSLTEQLCLLTSTSRHELDFQLRASSTNDSQMLWADCQHPNWPSIKQRTHLSRKMPYLTHSLWQEMRRVANTSHFSSLETISSEWRGPGHECHFGYARHTSKQNSPEACWGGVLGVRLTYLTCFRIFFLTQRIIV